VKEVLGALQGAAAASGARVSDPSVRILQVVPIVASLHDRSFLS